MIAQAQNSAVGLLKQPLRSVTARATNDASDNSSSRRGLLFSSIGAAVVAAQAQQALARPSRSGKAALSIPYEENRICTPECVERLNSDPSTMVDLGDGLKYQDIVVGEGPSPMKGYQCECHFVAYNSDGQLYENTISKGDPLLLRYGAGQLIRGVDIGIADMKIGGKRRLYIPGSLAYTQNVKAAPGRPVILANTPVMFDLWLIDIPGLVDNSDDAEILTLAD